jgi:hypothetical protein
MLMAKSFPVNYDTQQDAHNEESKVALKHSLK